MMQDDYDPASEIETPTSTTFQDQGPPHLATENMMTAHSAPRQQESGPATKRIRVGAAPQRRTLEEKINCETSTENAGNSASAIEISRSANNGDGSITVRREMLDEFGKQNKHHYEKTAHIGRHPDGVVLTKPIRPKCQAAPHPTQRPSVPTTAAAKLVKKPASSDHHHHNHHHHHAAYRGPELTPVRIKPRFKKEDVEATNDGYAPVAKLAAWLADNPTSNKKVSCVRKGANVIAKSRKFERDLENVIIEENGIEVGGVADKKQWLKSAFSEDNSDTNAPHVNVTDKRNWLAHAFKRGDDEDDDHIAAETASEILSVTDKKKWLEAAFKKGSDGKTTKIGKATSMVNIPRGDDATTRAKKKWQENSARRLAAARESLTRKSLYDSKLEHGKMEEVSMTEPCAATDMQHGQFAGANLHSRREEFARSNEQDDDMVWESETGSSSEDAAQHPLLPVVEEDKTSVDFKAARELLINRSKQNGNPLSVVSKVQRRKQIFERFEKEHKRRSEKFGLLRPSWEPVAEPVEGPTTAYKKTYVEDIVPKKSFEDLP